MKLKGKDTFLIGSFYRSPSSSTDNNDNHNKLLDKISEKIFHYLEISTTLGLIGKQPQPQQQVLRISTEDKGFKFIEKRLTVT